MISPKSYSQYESVAEKVAFLDVHTSMLLSQDDHETHLTVFKHLIKHDIQFFSSH